MNETQAITAFAALAHHHRLSVFRMLVEEGPEGLAAGAIAERLGIAPSALSFHLSNLERAGLVRASRAGQNRLYAIEVDGMRALLAFLSDDCCGGRPELCAPLAAATPGVTKGSRHDRC